MSADGTAGLTVPITGSEWIWAT